MASLGYTCFHCKSPIENGYHCLRCICEKCGNNCSNRFCTVCNLFITPNSLHGSPNLSDDPPQTSSLKQLHCVSCGDQLGDGSICERCNCKDCGFSHELCACYVLRTEPTFTSDYDQNFCEYSQNNYNYIPHNPYEQESYNPNFNDASYHNTPSLSCEFCGGPHQGFECQTGNTFVYEQFSGNTQDFENNQIPYYSHNQSQQSFCCEYCGGPHFSSDCQIRNPFPCNNYDIPDQTPQYLTIQSTLLQTQSLEVLELIKELKEELTRISHEKSMDELLAEERAAKIDSQIAYEKSVRESIEREKAARASSRFRFIPDDSDDEDTLDILQCYKNSSHSSNEISQIQTLQGEKDVEELLADEHMEIIKPLNASPSQLPQSAVITPEVHTHSLSMGDEHLDTIPEKESHEFIKSSVENLVPIPRESQGILEHLCDIPPPLVFPNNHVEMFSDSNDDDSLSCGDIVYVEDLPSELVSLEEENDDETDNEIQDEALRATLLNASLLISRIEAFNEIPISSPIPIKDSDLFSDDSIPELEAFSFDHMGEKISGSTTSYSHPPLPEYDSFTFEEFSGELIHIISPPEYDNFYFDLDKDISCVPGGDVLSHENLLKIPTLPPIICLDHMSLNDEIHDTPIMNSLTDDDESILIVIKIFLPFFTYRVTSPLLHSFGNEDIIFDPGILADSFHYSQPGVCLSHRCGTFAYFKCLSKHFE